MASIIKIILEEYMALRNIRTDGDEVLRKIAREVDRIDSRILTLIKDMAETMYLADGVGLAAPQVGVLKRIVVIDVGEGLLELINPRIIEQTGEQIKVEGCLSVPGQAGEVKRPAYVKAEALNMSGEKVTIEGRELLAVALSHEIDHLDGILFTDKAIKMLDKNDLENKK
jgi:peptide deformylase